MINSRLALAFLALAGSLSLAACETVGEVVGEGMRATLSGTEPPTRGDPDGRGMAEFTTVDRTDNLCYELTVSGIETPTVAHIHRGARGTVGPPVVTLDTPTDGESNGCLAVDSALVDEIERNPGGFYVNVHNTPYPTGAVRGQLTR